jgi:uncharacterized repeat protein (TIGR01451 family)
MFLVFLVASLVAGARAEAQGFFGLGVTSSASSIQVSNSLTYTINVTNLTGFLLPDMVVSNALPASVQFVNALPAQGSYTNYGSVTVFDLGPLGDGGIVQMSLTVQPTSVGFITNTVTVADTNGLYQSVSTNIVTQVTNAILPQADLGVTLVGPAQQTNIVNDLITYSVIATNAGPSDAPNVILSNAVPAGVFNLGTLVSGGFTNLQFTVQPTNAGLLTFSAFISAAGVLDTNTANDSASNNVTVINYLSGPLYVVTNSAQTLNFQNGLTEQSIIVSNNTSADVAAVRVVVTNLTRQLFNAIGTNNGNPYVVLNTTLPVGQSVNLLLQFAPRGSFPLANSQLQAFAVPVLNLTPPAATSTSASLNISRILPLANGSMLIEFPSALGQTYTVVYSDNVSFSNAAIAPPSIVAPANRVQWIDYGPPTTTSAPTNFPKRFYRVYLNQ